MTQPLPISRRYRVIWVLNAACPSRCVYCDIESQRRISTLSEVDVRRIAGEVVEAGFREVTFVGGEPLLSPELVPALERLAGKCDVAVFTGGIPGDQERWVRSLSNGVTRVVLSLDSGDERLNDRVRGRLGITRALFSFAELLRKTHPAIDLSVNTVVTRHNVDALASVWQAVAHLRPSSWSLTLAGDNFQGSPQDHLLGEEAVRRFYLQYVPRFAGALRRYGAELVVLPIPVVFLVNRIPLQNFADEAPHHRQELVREFSRYANGDYNESFVGAYGCPLIGTDITIGVGGDVHPCSQAPAIRPEYVMGNLRSQSLDSVLEGRAIEGFRAGVPHAPCRRCWAPSNIEQGELVNILKRPRHSS